jgi:hypothetical protein
MVYRHMGKPGATPQVKVVEFYGALKAQYDIEMIRLCDVCNAALSALGSQNYPLPGPLAQAFASRGVGASPATAQTASDTHPNL